MIENLIVFIPARGGSARCKNKNLRIFCGRPLLWYSIEFAGNIGLRDRCYVSSDNDEILEFADVNGAVAIRRPVDLAAPGSRISDAAIHLIKKLSNDGIPVDYVLLLQPTNPLRGTTFFKQLVGLMETSGADCVFTVYTAREKWGEVVDGQFIPRNYSFEDQFHHNNRYMCENGMMYLFRTCSLLTTGSLFGRNAVPLKVEDIFRNNDIDNETDLAIAELIYQKYKDKYGFP